MIYKITKNKEGLTLKEYLRCFSLGKGKIEAIRSKKLYKINQETPSWEKAILHEGDILQLDIEEDIDFEIENKEIKVLYEDEYILAIYKTPDCVIYPEGKIGKHTLVNYIANYYKRNGICHAIRYIYRLDKETSGVFLIAKDWLSEASLCHQMEEGKIKKYYYALIEGTLKNKKGTLSFPIAKDRHINNHYRVDEKSGKEAITRYIVQKEKSNISLVECDLVTGRTHQIRVHFSHLGNSLIGDTSYGSKIKAKRVMLHAHKIVFKHPIFEKEMEIACELPEDMKEFLEK